MVDLLFLRFDAPLMSFGGVLVDEHGVTRELPGLSMITGLLGNALGFHHRDYRWLQRLQERLRYAVRQDRAGEKLVDYQTVDLGQEFMQCVWTTRGTLERRGGASKTATHQRYRHYWAGAAYTLAVTLDPAAEGPSLNELETALRSPARPLFLGRKCCLPATSLLLGRGQGESLLSALAGIEPLPTPPEDGSWKAWWPEGEASPAATPTRRLAHTDRRDWANQVHTGRRFITEGRLRLATEPNHG